MKSVLITGGDGFIAGHTIEEANKRGYKVYTNIRHGAYYAQKPDYLYNVDIYNVDNRDKAGMRAIMEKVDGVINLAGLLGTKNVKSGREFYENNLFSAIGIFENAVDLNLPIIQIAVGNYFETNDYSNSKVAAERECIKFSKYLGMKGNVVRGLNAYGERQKVHGTGKIVPTFIDKALKNKPLEVYGGKDNCGIMDMIYVKDLSKILLNVLEATSTEGSSFGNIVEAGTGHGDSVFDIANKIVELSESKSEIIEVPMRSGESLKSVVVAETPHAMDFTTIEDGLKRTIEYYRELNKFNPEYANSTF